MGYNNAIFVLKALRGQKLAYPWKDKKGKPTTRTIDADDIAFLTLVALKERDPDTELGYPPEDCLGFASEDEFVETLHISHPTFLETRKFLKANDFIKYDRALANCKDIDDSTNTKATYSSVYRLNFPFINTFAPDLIYDATIRRKREQERRARVHKGSVATLEGSVATPKGSVATLKGSVATLKGSVATPDNNREERDNKHHHDDDANSIMFLVNWTRDYIAKYFNLTPEESCLIGDLGLRKAVSGKDPEAIVAKIASWGTQGVKPKKFPKCIAWWINELKSIPASSSPAALTREQLEAQFTPPERVAEPTEEEKRQALFDATWQKLVAGDAFNLCTPAETAELQALLRGKIMNRVDPQLKTRIDNFCDNILNYYSADKRTKVLIENEINETL